MNLQRQLVQSSILVGVVVVTAPGLAGMMTNSATVSSPTTDPNPANNTATATTSVTGVADLAIGTEDLKALYDQYHGPNVKDDDDPAEI